MEEGKVGMMELWKNGRMEEWNDGMLSRNPASAGEEWKDIRIRPPIAIRATIEEINEKERFLLQTGNWQLATSDWQLLTGNCPLPTSNKKIPIFAQN